MYAEEHCNKWGWACIAITVDHPLLQRKDKWFWLRAHVVLFPASSPRWGGGLNCIDVLGSSGHFPDFLIIAPPPKIPLAPPGVGWVNFWNRMIPGSIRTCVPNLDAVRTSCRKDGVETDTHTQRDTAA